MYSCFSEFRRAKGKTQEQMAEELNISQSTITAYETGKRKPSVKVLERMMDVYGLTLNEVWTFRLAPSDEAML